MILSNNFNPEKMTVKNNEVLYEDIKPFICQSTHLKVNLNQLKALRQNSVLFIPNDKSDEYSEINRIIDSVVKEVKRNGAKYLFVKSRYTFKLGFTINEVCKRKIDQLMKLNVTSTEVVLTFYIKCEKFALFNDRTSILIEPVLLDIQLWKPSIESLNIGVNI